MRRNLRELDEKKGAGWMSTYSDLVTLLLCFFVMLFAMSSIDIEKFRAVLNSFTRNVDVLPGGASVSNEALISSGVSQMTELEVYFESRSAMDSTEDGQELNDEMLKLAERIKSYLQKQGYGSDVNVEYSAQLIKLTLPGEILFDSAKADLREEAVELVEIIATMLKQDAFMDKTIQIEGHTDNLPIHTIRYLSNWELSSSRAISVARRFIQNYGFSPDKIAATGYGEYRPVADNTTVEGRARNRRVEIKIINEVYIEENDLD